MFNSIERYRSAVAGHTAAPDGSSAEEDATAERTWAPIWREMRANPPITLSRRGAVAALRHLMEEGAVSHEDAGIMQSVLAFLERPDVIAS